jgi:hypothetical protein
MASGDPWFDLMQLETDAGVAASYANAAAFTGAGWDLSFKQADGTVLSPQPTWTVVDEGSGLHRINVVAEPDRGATAGWYAEITVPSGYYTPSLSLGGLGEPYELADLMAQIMSSASSSGAVAAARVTDELEDWVEGDSFRLDVTFTAAQLAKIGKTTLTGVTIIAGAKLAFPAKDSDDTNDISFIAAAVDVTALTALITLDTFPVGGALADDVEAVPYIIDISIKNAADGRIYTALRYAVNIVWEADRRTS